jgi:hypothetical protein
VCFYWLKTTFAGIWFCTGTVKTYILFLCLRFNYFTYPTIFDLKNQNFTGAGSDSLSSRYALIAVPALVKNFLKTGKKFQILQAWLLNLLRYVPPSR